MAKVHLIPQKSMNQVVSHVEGVKKAVKNEAEDVLDLAEALHNATTKEREFRTTFSVTTGDVDSFANMDHPHVIPREFGWKDEERGIVVPGKYTMQKAAGLA